MIQDADNEPFVMTEERREAIVKRMLDLGVSPTTNSVFGGFNSTANSSTYPFVVIDESVVHTEENPMKDQRTISQLAIAAGQTTGDNNAPLAVANEAIATSATSDVHINDTQKTGNQPHSNADCQLVLPEPKEEPMVDSPNSKPFALRVLRATQSLFGVKKVEKPFEPVAVVTPEETFSFFSSPFTFKQQRRKTFHNQLPGIALIPACE